MTWEIFLGIVALVGFFVTVGTPILKLNTSIIRLNESVNVLRDVLSKSEMDNKEAHKRIWNHLDDIDATVKNHEERLTKGEAAIAAHTDKTSKLEQETANQERRITVIETEVVQHEKEIANNTNRLNKT